MSAFDILHQHYAFSTVRRSETPAAGKSDGISAEVLGVLAKHKCEGKMDAIEAMAMDVYALGKLHGEGKSA